jgi:hypothetical protein
VPLADRLTAVVGPKVFTNRQRQFSSSCFGTNKKTSATKDSAIATAPVACANHYNQ